MVEMKWREMKLGERKKTRKEDAEMNWRIESLEPGGKSELRSNEKIGARGRRDINKTFTVALLLLSDIGVLIREKP